MRQSGPRDGRVSFPVDDGAYAIHYLPMLNDIATAANLRSLDIATLRAWHRDASDSATVCMPGTATHRLRVEWLSDIAAELRSRGC